jgi:glutamyl/glutaminyl-tRNA synthetase
MALPAYPLLHFAAARAMAVLDPLKVVIENYPDDQVEELEASNHPQNEAMGKQRKRTSPPSIKRLYLGGGTSAKSSCSI